MNNHQQISTIRKSRLALLVEHTQNKHVQIYSMQLGLEESKFMNALIKRYNWDKIVDICRHEPNHIRCMLRSTNTPLNKVCNIGSVPVRALKQVLDYWVKATMVWNCFGKSHLHIKYRNSQYSSTPVALLIECNGEALKMVNNTACFQVIRALVAAYPDVLTIQDIHGHAPMDLLWA